MQTPSGTSLTPRTFQERAARCPAYQQIRLVFSDFTAAATSQALAMFNVPARCGVKAVQIICTTPFTGGAISAMTMSVGISGTATKFSTAVDVFTAAINSYQEVTASSRGVQSISAATALIATFTSTGANVTAATAGQVDICVDLVDYNFLDDES